MLHAADTAPSSSALERVPRPNDLIRLLPRRTPSPTQPVAEIKAQIDKFFNTLKAGDSTKAYEELLIGSRLGERKENVRMLIDKTDQAFGVYGKMTGVEVFDNYMIGANVSVTVYLMHLPAQPIRWRFVYYKPETTWRLIDLRVDDVLDDLIE